MLKSALLIGILLSTSQASGSELIYEGTWKTTNRKLDGTMTCIITPVGKEAWKGRFYGIWQGVDFDYTVDFTGPRTALKGIATIDGAGYRWAARLEEHRFRANFNGDRYEGSFDLKRKPPAEVATAKSPVKRS